MTAARELEVIDDGSRAAVLLHPTRLAMLEELREPDSATGLSRKLGLPRQQLAYHLRALEEHGLVELVEERRRGNCLERVVQATARAYLIDPAVLGAIAGDPERVHDRLSASYLIAAAGSVIRDVARLERRAAASRKRLPTLAAQVEVRFATPADRAAFARELTETLAVLAARYHDASAPGGRTYRFLACGHPAVKAQARDPDAHDTRTEEEP